MKPAEAAAADWFGRIGLPLSPIPVSQNGKRADFERVTGLEDYLVQCKDKDDPVEHKELLAEAVKNGAANGAAAVSRNNTISGIFKDAEDQLVATPAAPSAFRVVWFTSFGANASLVAERAVRTLFGLTTVIPFPNMRTQLDPKDCFYFGMNDFFRLKEIDAALVCEPGRLRLCVNNFSTRYASFQKSTLYSKFRVPMDPLTAEAAGYAYVLDGPVNRAVQAEAQRVLSDKYGWYGVSAMVEAEFTSIVTN